MALTNLIDVYGSSARAQGNVSVKDTKSTKVAASKPLKIVVPTDIVSISSSTERSPGAKPSEQTLPRVYLRYQRETKAAKRNLAISGGITAALVVSGLLVPPLAGVYLLYAAGVGMAVTFMTSIPFATGEHFNNLAIKIDKLEPKAQKETLEQIYAVDPDLADRLEDRIENINRKVLI